MKKEKTIKPKKAERKESLSDDLKLGVSKGLVEKIIFGIIIFILAVFFIRTAIWEYNYYKTKEGSPRTPAQTSQIVDDAPELDETPVTEEQIINHVVPAEDPRYLSIAKLGIRNARVLSEGVKANGELDTPLGIFDVGWYNASGRPGQGKVILIDGHNGGPNVVGVFKYLNQLVPGDIITLERGDGAKFDYRVVENTEIALDEANEYMKTAMSSPEPPKEALTLITCIGEWSQARQTYLSRQFVRAVLVS